MGGLLAFRVGNFDNTAEREQFRFLCEQLKVHYENSGDFCVFAGNYNIGCELDALFIKKDAIIAIEFKNYGGNVIANENGEWTCDDKVIKGGSRKTVLQQARINHSTIKRELKVLGVSSNNIKDVPTLIIFNQPVNISNKLSATNKSWLHITDNEHFIEKLDDITCPQTDLDPLGIVNLAELLNLNSFFLTEFSNATYEKPSKPCDQIEIFEDIKENEGHGDKERAENVIANPDEECQKSQESNSTLEHGDVIVEKEVSKMDTPSDLIPLRDYSHQIVMAVCGNGSYEINALKSDSFISLFPSFAHNICHETVIVLSGDIPTQDLEHLSRFLRKEVTPINSNISFWQTGDLLPSMQLNCCEDEHKGSSFGEEGPSNILPNWLDDLLYKDLKAKFSPDHVRYEYNLDLNKEEVLIYLGTYFPRSFAETNILFTEFTQNSSYAAILKDKSCFNVLDFGCGCGGDVFGVLYYIEKCLPAVKEVKLLAIDGNQVALRMFEKIMSAYKVRTRLRIDVKIGPMFVQDDDDLNMMSSLLSEKYDLVLSCKAICEILAKNRITSKAYKSTTAMLASKLSDTGILFVEDVTVKSPMTNEFIPKTLSSELNEFIRENDDYVTLSPHACRLKGEKCLAGCFYKRNMVVSHSRKQNDLSKVVYRFIGHREMLNRLKFEEYNDSIVCNL